MTPSRLAAFLACASLAGVWACTALVPSNACATSDDCWTGAECVDGTCRAGGTGSSGNAGSSGVSPDSSSTAGNTSTPAGTSAASRSSGTSSAASAGSSASASAAPSASSSVASLSSSAPATSVAHSSSTVSSSSLSTGTSAPPASSTSTGTSTSASTGSSSVAPGSSSTGDSSSTANSSSAGNSSSSVCRCDPDPAGCGLHRDGVACGAAGCTWQDNSACQNTITSCNQAANAAQCVGLGCTSTPARCTGTHGGCNTYGPGSCSLHGCSESFSCTGTHATCDNIALNACSSHGGCSIQQQCLGGNHPGCGTWNYVGGQADCESHACTWNGDGAAQRCTGPPHTCAQSNCDYAGCNTQNVCAGTPNHGCGVETVATCNSANCASFADCAGSPHACSDHDGDQLGCMAASCVHTGPTCTGTVRPCGTFPQGTCNAQVGCNWVPSGMCQPPAGCNGPVGNQCDPGCVLLCN